jgi:hypothetical protein
MSRSSAARSSSLSAATRLHDATSSWNSATVIVGSLGNVADSSGPNSVVSSNASRQRPLLGMFAGRVPTCGEASSRADSSSLHGSWRQRACG